MAIIILQNLYICDLNPFQHFLQSIHYHHYPVVNCFKGTSFFLESWKNQELASRSCMHHREHFATFSMISSQFPVKKHFLLNQELAWRCMYHAQGWKPALNLLLLHRVPPISCTSALCFLIVVLFIF